MNVQNVLDQFELKLIQIHYIQIWYIQFCIKIGWFQVNRTRGRNRSTSICPVDRVSCPDTEIRVFFFLPQPKTDTTQQHNWKKGFSNPRKASVFVSLSDICLLYTYTYVEMSHQLFILFLREKKEKRLIRSCEFELSKSNTGRMYFQPIPISP